MSLAGMDFRAILSALTTNPARRFGFGGQEGRIEAGMDADLTVLDGDPGKDTEAFARVRATFRSGEMVFSKP